MTVTFWGVRGSIAAPGAHTLRYGGNTSCVSVEAGDSVLVLDAGTGIRAAGERLAGIGKQLIVLLSHIHTDHISGFPFFAPIHQEGRLVHLLDYDRAGYRWSLLDLLDGVHCPIRSQDLPSRCRRVEADMARFLAKHGFTVSRLPMNHPGGAYGYRIEVGGRVLVYMPDNELEPPGWERTGREAFVDFCRGADVLCHDAQFVQADLPDKQGWGHSLVRQVTALAAAAGVKHLVLFHHDPDRSDEMLDAIEAEARAQLADRGVACTAAYEGLTITLAGEDAVQKASPRVM